MKRFNWGQFGGQLGVAFCVGGLLLVFFGWNGAASRAWVPAQMPYLISGGVAGLSLVMIGAALMMVQTLRADRAQMQDSIDELRAALERMALASSAARVNGDSGAVAADLERRGMVVVGRSTYHRPTCRLVESRADLPVVGIAAAEEQGLRPCRVCDAAALAAIS